MKLIIANWKMNPSTEAEAVALAKESDIRGLMIAPPLSFLEGVKNVLKQAELCAQDVFWKGSGAYTGEVSAEELASLGVRYVIVGHSERRALGETDEMVAKKVLAVLENKMTPILCVGESAAERAAGRTEEVISRELRIGLSLLGSERFALGDLHLVIAYEPLWAIGTGTPNTPQDTIKVVSYIKDVLIADRFPLVAKVLYGGSIDSKNAESFLREPQIDGALVGGASLNAEEIKKIVETAVRCQSTNACESTNE